MEHIGNKIKSLIEDSRLTAVEIAKEMNTSYQNLYRIFNRESVDTRYLYEIARILNIPVTTFFENDPDAKISKVDIEKLQNENIEWRNRVNKLEREVENLVLLIEFIKKENLLDSDKIQSRNNKELDIETRKPLSSLFTEFEEDITSEAQKEVFKFFNSDNLIYKTKEEKWNAFKKWVEDSIIMGK